ncbi:hypothetical protein GCM10011418_08940 [Sphingobacterium alkalisoli]|nr:hypothetical protein GCM10011418_08940 [Sphingobacterium alkalisoli]
MLYAVGYGQELGGRAKEGTKKELTASEIYQRIQRVGYERELKIDSAKAMVLVLADKIVQQRIQGALQNREMTVNSKAQEIKRAKDEREQMFREVLTKEQLAKVYGAAKGNASYRPLAYGGERKGNASPPLDLTKTSTEESERIHLQHIRELQERQNRIFERRATKPVAPERPVPPNNQDRGK